MGGLNINVGNFCCKICSTSPAGTPVNQSLEVPFRSEIFRAWTNPLRKVLGAGRCVVRFFVKRLSLLMGQATARFFLLADIKDTVIIFAHLCFEARMIRMFSNSWSTIRDSTTSWDTNYGIEDLLRKPGTDSVDLSQIFSQIFILYTYNAVKKNTNYTHYISILDIKTHQLFKQTQ